MTPETAPVRVTIARTDPGDVGQRQVIVSIDGGPAAYLAFGESVVHDLSAGDHLLKANNTLVWRKIPFTAAPGEHVQFMVANRSSRFTLGFLALLGVAPLRMTVERITTHVGGNDGTTSRPFSAT